MDREPSLAAVLPRQPGTKESRYAHLLSGPVESIAVAAPDVFPQSSVGGERIERLEAEVSDLRRQVDELRQKIETLFA